jgi:hypothetical protein
MNLRFVSGDGRRLRSFNCAGRLTSQITLRFWCRCSR